MSPKDGDVWISTEAGLTRYSSASNSWKYYPMAGKGAVVEVTCLAFGGSGTLYAGTQCDGLLIGSPDGDYKASPSFWTCLYA